MAEDTAVVEQTQDVSTTTDTKTPETATTDQTKTQTTSTQKPATGTNSGDEDRRFKGIQADLAKERKTRQEYEAKVKQFETELAAERKRVQALAGVNPVDPSEAEAEEVRKRFAQLYPHLGGLTAEEIEEMREMASERKSLQATTDHYWQTHGRAMIGSVQKEIAATYGDLSDKQNDAITKAYVLRAQVDPEFLARHEAGDPALAKEFAKEWVDTWFEPARRKITAGQVQQFRGVPNSKDRSIVNQGEKKINVNNNDEVMDLLVQGRTFTGRH